MFRVGLNVEPHSSSFAQRKIFHCAPLCNSTRPAHLSKSCVMLHAHFALILHYLIARVVVPCFGFLMCIQKHSFLSPFISIFFFSLFLLFSYSSPLPPTIPSACPANVMCAFPPLFTVSMEDTFVCVQHDVYIYLRNINKK